ncbi:prestin-like isoform X2 [Dermacentor variabilis]|uniref:prestin-like isoform X2 n=2 Tax=Dermacentor variabilis TaxID=34621 RepID=UPI003F5AFB16
MVCPRTESFNSKPPQVDASSGRLSRDSGCPNPTAPVKRDYAFRRCSMNPQDCARYGVHRPSFTQAGFNDTYIQLPKHKTVPGDVLKRIGKSQCNTRHLKHQALRLLPVFGWLRTYRVKEYLLADVVTGFTVAMFQVPQSLGYTLLASVPPVFALYNAMFPMMIYIIMGTVRQASVGADAIMSMMTGGIVRELISGDTGGHHPMVGIHNGTHAGQYTVTQVTSALCFTIGIIQLVFGFLSLGTLNVFLSEQMVNGFATGVAVQVVISQLGSIFGNHVPHMSGMFTIYKTLYAFFEHIHEVAWQTTLVAFVAIVVIMVVKLFLDPPVIRRLGIPLPIELTVVVLFTVGSHYLKLRENYGVEVVGTIPEKLPEPTLPSFNTHLIASILPESFALAIVSFAITLSLGRIFGQKHGYAVDANQEFLALGASHVFSSFFSCFPIAASVPRSAVQEGAGGKTQIVSVVNIAIIVLMVLFLGHYLEELPICVLAAIIVTSLKKIVMQVQDFKRYWDISKIDGQVWMVSFGATVIFDVITGLAIGVGFSLLTLIYKIQRPKTFLLGSVADTEFFVPIKKYQMVDEIPKIKIFHFGGPVHFANTEYFKEQLNKKIGFTVRDILKARKRAQKGSTCNLANLVKDSPMLGAESKNASLNCSVAADLCSLKSSNSCVTEMLALPTHIILDFSRVSFMDGSSIALLKSLKRDYDSVDVKLFIAACSDNVFDFLRKADAVEFLGSDAFFPSVFDAVQAAQHPNKFIGAIPEPPPSIIEPEPEEESEDSHPEASEFL